MPHPLEWNSNTPNPYFQTLRLPRFWKNPLETASLSRSNEPRGKRKEDAFLAKISPILATTKTRCGQKAAKISEGQPLPLPNIPPSSLRGITKETEDRQRRVEEGRVGNQSSPLITLHLFSLSFFLFFFRKKRRVINTRNYRPRD